MGVSHGAGCFRVNTHAVAGHDLPQLALCEAMWEFHDGNDIAAAISLDVGRNHPRDAVTGGGPPAGIPARRRSRPLHWANYELQATQPGQGRNDDRQESTTGRKGPFR